MSTVLCLICLGPSFQKMTNHVLLHESLRPTYLEKSLKPWLISLTFFRERLEKLEREKNRDRKIREERARKEQEKRRRKEEERKLLQLQQRNAGTFTLGGILTVK